jgi:Na+/proline symporter
LHGGELPAALQKLPPLLTMETLLFRIITAGFVLLTLASYGMDQDLVQRMLTCQNAAKGARSVISGVLVGIPAVCIFLVLGLLLYIFYQRPDIMGAASPGYTPPDDSPFETFAYREMNGGLAGLFLAGLFAAGPAGINSGLNSMASTFVTDIYQSRVKGRNETHYLKVGRLAVVGAGVVLGLFACLCIVLYDPKNTTLISFALSVMNYAYAGLLGMFFTALFTKRGNTASVTAGWVAGFVTVLALEPSIMKIWAAELKCKPIVIAFPWRLVISTVVATSVCMIGTRKKIAAPLMAASVS